MLTKTHCVHPWGLKKCAECISFLMKHLRSRFLKYYFKSSLWLQTAIRWPVTTSCKTVQYCETNGFNVSELPTWQWLCVQRVTINKPQTSNSSSNLISTREAGEGMSIFYYPHLADISYSGNLPPVTNWKEGLQNLKKFPWVQVCTIFEEIPSTYPWYRIQENQMNGWANDLKI